MKNNFHNTLLCKNCKNRTAIILQFPFSKRISLSEKINFKERNFRKKTITFEEISLKKKKRF